MPSPIRPAPELLVSLGQLAHGVYRFTPHPIYLGALLVCLGVPVYVSSLYGALVLVALIPRRGLP